MNSCLYITISNTCVQYSPMYMFIGVVIEKQRVFVTSNKRMGKKSIFYAVCELSARKTECLNRFKIQCESSMVLHGNT